MKYLVILALFVINLGCGQQNKTKQMKTEFTPYQQQLYDNLDANCKQKKIKYSFVVFSRLPYRLFINGLLAGEHKVPNPDRELNSNTHYRLENYVLGNGTYTAKIEFYPMGKDREEFHEDGLIHPEDFEDRRIDLLRWEEIDGQKENISLHKEYRFTIKEPVANLEQEMEFTISDLPYQVKGWTESQDLRKIDKEVLEKEVVAYYTYLREILNTGQKHKYTYELQVTRNLEASTLSYSNKKEYEEALKDNATRITKEKMYPLEGYRMAIEGDGKLVTLYKTDNEFLNWSVLMYNDGEYRHSLGVKLHKPKGSDIFEIITK